LKALEGAQMQKPLPKWEMWKHVPKLSAVEAVALSLNVDPAKVYKWSKGKWVFNGGSGMAWEVAGFSDRLFLFTRCFGALVEMSLKELANWSQSVDWNVPVELAALAPWPSVVHELTPAETVNAAVASIVAASEDVAELRREIETEGWRFVLVGGESKVHIQDGTNQGRLEPIENLYSLMCELCAYSKNKRLAHLVRASGSSGGGALGSSFVQAPVPRVAPSGERASPEPPFSESGASKFAQQSPLATEERPTSPADRRARLDISRERGARRRIIESWNDIEKEYGPNADGRQVLRVLNRDKNEDAPVLKTVQNHLSALRAEGLIP
jgi:hypothetical protein